MLRKKMVFLVLLLIIVTLFSVSLAFAETYINLNKLEMSKFPNADAIVSVINMTDTDVTPISNLTAGNFSVHEDRNAVEDIKVRLFEGTEHGVSIIVVIDASGSIKGNALKKVKYEIGRFVSELRPQDSAGILSFNDNIKIAFFKKLPNGKSSFDGLKDDEKFPPEVPETTKPMFTNDPAEFSKAVNSVEIGGKISVLYQSVRRAVDIVSKSSGIYKGVIVISDGHNEDPAYNDIDLCIKSAREKNIPISAIGVGWGGSKWLQYMSMFAEETGGIYRPIGSPEQIDRAFNTLKNLLMKQYVLSFNFAKVQEDGKEHELTVFANVNGMQKNAQMVFKTEKGIPPDPVTKIQTALDNNTDLGGKISAKEDGKQIALSGEVSSKDQKKLAKKVAENASPESKIDNSGIKVVKSPKPSGGGLGEWLQKYYWIIIIVVSAIVLTFAVIIAVRTIKKRKIEKEEIEDDEESDSSEEIEEEDDLDESENEESPVTPEPVEDSEDNSSYSEAKTQADPSIDEEDISEPNVDETAIWGRLTVTKEGVDDKVYELIDEQITIGTAPDDTITIEGESLGEIPKIIINWRQDEGAELEYYGEDDLVSVNGEFTRNAKLSNSDVIQVGSYTLTLGIS